MGCCTSRPYDEGGGTASSHAINHHPQSAGPGSAHSNRQPQRSGPSLATPVNHPFRNHVWSSKKRMWTPSRLEHEREDFFFTRVSGRPEVWQALRTALEAMRISHGDVSTSQQIIDAAGITLPTGDLAQGGAYDSFGNFYQFPEFVVADPENLVPDVEVEDDGSKDVGGNKSENASEELDEEAIERRRAVKGKGVSKPENEIIVKVRRSDGVAGDMVITAQKDDIVRVLARRLAYEASITPPKTLRLVYMGKMLKEEESLLDQGWSDENIVHGMVVGAE